MLERLSPPPRGLILDMDGVLWKDDDPIGDLPEIFHRIQARGLQVVLATNNATKTVDEYLSKLRSFGVTLEPWQIVTSSEATAHVLAKRFPQLGPVFVVGENGIVSALRQKGFMPITDPDDETCPIAVVSSFDRRVTFQKLRRATLHIRAGVAFYGTNGDRTFPTPAGLIPGAGSILAALEAATDVKPTVIGKPSAFMLAISTERMRLANDEILVVGDRLETDVAGGQSVGAHTALVLSGVSTLEQANVWTPKPDLIVGSLSDLLGAG